MQIGMLHSHLMWTWATNCILNYWQSVAIFHRNEGKVIYVQSEMAHCFANDTCLVAFVVDQIAQAESFPFTSDLHDAVLDHMQFVLPALVMVIVIVMMHIRVQQVRRILILVELPLVSLLWPCYDRVL